MERDIPVASIGSNGFKLFYGRYLQVVGLKGNAEAKRGGFHQLMLRRGNVFLQIKWLMLAYMSS